VPSFRTRRGRCHADDEWLWGRTRPRFVVTYEVGGETGRRYVVMPSLWLSYGEAAFRRANETFRNAGVVVVE